MIGQSSMLHVNAPVTNNCLGSLPPQQVTQNMHVPVLMRLSFRDGNYGMKNQDCQWLIKIVFPINMPKKCQSPPILLLKKIGSPL